MMDPEEAGRIPVEALARRIKAIGFRCQRCGECCSGPDAEVLVFPSEVRRIVSHTGQSWLEVVEPPETGVWDAEGNFHTLEWMLRRHGNGCAYYDAASGSCRIYPARPDICRTYPFYLDGDELRVSECRGLGMEMDDDEALRIAQELKRRLVSEMMEERMAGSRFSGFVAAGRPERPTGVCIVHDGEGAHRLPLGAGEQEPGNRGSVPKGWSGRGDVER